MTGREYLHKVRAARLQLTILEKEELQINSDIKYVSALDYTVPRVSGGGKGNDTADKISRLIEAQTKIRQEYKTWSDLRKEARRLIKCVPDYCQQAILIERYLHNKKIYEIAGLIGYSIDSTKRMHRQALEKFDEIFAKNKS